MFSRLINQMNGRPKPLESSASAGGKAWVIEFGWMAAVWFVAFAVCLIHLNHTPEWDEMYAVLAGQSWLRDGTFAIAHGTYTRAPLYTIIVAEFMRCFGTNLVAARLPSVLAGSLTVVLIYRFVTREAGRSAGLFAAGIFCFQPLSICTAQLARFYALHALCFWVGGYAVFKAARCRTFNRNLIFWTMLAIFSLVLAYQFQITTLVGVGALGIWFAIQLMWWSFLRFFDEDSKSRWIFPGVVSGIILALAAGCWVAWRTGFLGFLLHTFHHTAIWNSARAVDWHYYHRWMMSQTPILWTCFPLAVLIALRQRPSFAFFSTTVFAIIFIVHSLAAQKADRYLFYSLPFFFAVWGIALSFIVPRTLRILREVLSKPFKHPPPAGLIQGAVLCSGAAIALSLLFTNPATGTTLRMLLYSDAQWTRARYARGFPDYQAAVKTLKPIMATSSVVLTSCSVKSLYFFGRSDFEISATDMADTDTGREFGVDPRTGFPVISKAGSLAQIMQQHRSGLIVIEQNHWRSPSFVSARVADFIKTHTEVVPLPKDCHLLAFRWQH